MVSQEIIEIVLKAKNMANKALDQAKNKINEIDTTTQQNANKTSRLTQLTNIYNNAVNKLRTSHSGVSQSVGNLLTKINNLATNGKTAINNLGNSFRQLTTPFSTVAESMKTKWNTTMESLKSRWKTTTGSIKSTFQGVANSINNTKIGFAINTAIFGTLRTKIAEVKTSLSGLQGAFNTVKSTANTIASPFVNATNRMKTAVTGVGTSVNNAFSGIRTRISGISTTISSGLGTAFNNLKTQASSTATTITSAMGNAANSIKTKLGGALTTVGTKFKDVGSKAMNLQSNMSVVSQNIMNTFGQVGVTSMYEFTIGAARARDKIMSVTESITGSKAATAELKQSIKEAASQGNVGFNNIATAVNNIGIKYGLTNAQLNKTPAVLNQIGMYAQATGKSGEQAASMMNKAYDGLNGNFLQLKRNLGITEEQLKANGWSGAASDVDGYTAALEKCLAQKPELKSYMESYDYQMSKLKMDVSAAGREIGEQLLPWMKKGLEIFNQVNKACPQLLPILVGLGVAIVSISAAMATLLPIISVVKTLKDTFGALREAINLSENATKLYNKTSKGLSSLRTTISGLITKFRSLNLTTRLSTASQKAYNLAVRGMNSLKAVISGVITKIRNLNLTTKLATLSQKAYNLAVRGMSGLKAIISSAISLVRNLNLTTRIAAAGQALLNAVTMLNPWAIIAVAIIAVIAALIYLYNTNEDVRNSLNAVADTIKGALGNAWNWLMDILGQVQNAWNSLMSVFSGDTDILGALQSALGNAWNWIVTTITGWGQQLYLLGTQLWNYLVTSCQGIWTFLMEALNGVWLNITTTLTTWGQQLYLFAVQLWNNFVTGAQFVFITLPTQFIMWLYNCLVGLGQWGITLYNNAVSAATQFVNGFITWISQLPSRLWTWLMTTIQRILTWRENVKNQMLQAGSQAVNKFIQFIKTLPARAWQWLQNTVNKIKIFKTLAEYQIRTAAGKMIESFKNKIKNLPKTMWDELMHIKDKILSASGQLVQAIIDLGKNMLNNFKNALGIHSPGFMSQDIENEMSYIQDNITSSTGSIGDAVTTLADTMNNSFGNVDLSSNMQLPTLTDVMPEENVNKSVNVVGNKPYTKMAQTTTVETNTEDNTTSPAMSLNTEQITADTQLIMQQYQALTEQLTLNTTQINTQLQLTQTTMNNLALTNTTVTNQLQANNLLIINSYTQLAQRIQSSLNTIQTRNTQAWTNVKTTTQNNLNSILSSTKNVTQKMIDAWNKMKTSIIDAANKIKTQSTSHFNKLSDTIRTFYHKLQNPSGWGTPNRMSSRMGTTRRRGFSSVGSAIKQNMPRATEINKRVTLGTIRRNKYMNDDSVDYLGNMKNVKLSDLIRGNLVTDISLDHDGKGAGWSDTVSPNVKYIKKTADEWDMKGPVILGKYDTGLSFKVKEFEGGEPNISYDTFRKMAENVFSQCHYEFYWDSAKYGNWLAAFQNGGMNCSDSTDALVAMAHACGLPASKVHGKWNSLGHFWATVAGHKMDTTGWMLHRTWTPSQSHFGPAPKGLEQLQSNSDEVKHSGEVKIVVEHKFTGDVPDNISQEDLTEALNSLNKNTGWIKELVSNSYFQDVNKRVENKNKGKALRNG